MSKWIVHGEDNILPDWITSELSYSCFYCGAAMLNYFTKEDRCTNRKCSNPNCISFAAAKATFMFNVLSYKNIGFATCLDIARQGGYKNHVRMLEYVKYKPSITLDVYLRLHCFSGVDSAWTTICQRQDAFTLDELYNGYEGKHKLLLEYNKELLYDNLQYVELVERTYTKIADTPLREFNIMITGTPIGFSTKDHFIDSINEITQGVIVVYHQKTPRQSGVDFLIREPGSTTRGKVAKAINAGIPIVTSEEFITYLSSIINGIEE